MNVAAVAVISREVKIYPWSVVDAKDVVENIASRSAPSCLISFCLNVYISECYTSSRVVALEPAASLDAAPAVLDSIDLAGALTVLVWYEKFAE